MKKELIMVIEDVFFITGRGIVVLGTVQNEKVEVGQKVIVDPEFLPEIETEIKGIEALRKMLKVANQNDCVGLLLDGLTKNQVKKKMKIYTI
jgi:translation elongation factor EF-Tu-like GTPase